MILRTATLDDSDLILRWANSNDCMRWKRLTKQSIGRSQHKIWFEKRLNSDDCYIWIVVEDDIAVGQVRIEIQANSLVTDIYIEPKARGGGLARSAMDEALKLIRAKTGAQFEAVAVVHVENLPSIKLFERLGFQNETASGDWLTLRQNAMGR